MMDQTKEETLNLLKNLIEDIEKDADIYLAEATLEHVGNKKTITVQVGPRLS